LSEASKYGDTIIKRIIADWSNDSAKRWKDKALDLSIKAEQKFAEVKGKNASDVLLVVSLLTMLFERNIDVVCLATSDSDFTSLVQELREREKYVIGFGTKNAVKSFVNSFSKFVYLDDFASDVLQSHTPVLSQPPTNSLTVVNNQAKSAQPQPTIKPTPSTQPQQSAKTKTSTQSSTPLNNKTWSKANNKILVAIVEDLISKDGKVSFGVLAKEIQDKNANCSHKQLGYGRFITFANEFVRRNNKYKIRVEDGGSTQSIVHAKS
jgi:hypothetical protein